MERTTGLNTALGSTCAVISSTSLIQSSSLAPALGMILIVALVGLFDAVDRQVGAQEALGEGDRHGGRVGDDLQDLGGELGEGAGVQIAVLDQAEEHRLEVGIGALR